MTLNPAVFALLMGAFISCALVLYASYFGYRIVMSWDLKSGSERQLRLERRTYLISTALSYAFVFELLSLFLLIYTAERMHVLFVGAMCAAGTLNATPLGYPAMIAKTLGFIVSGVWLIINHLDTMAPDYPLIRVKYKYLLVIAPMMVIETGLLAGYLLGLRADVITSCCGALFSEGIPGIGADLASLPPVMSMIAFFGVGAVTLSVGLWYAFQDRGGIAYAILSGCFFLVSISAIISFISPYVYELPTHHCPFCLIKGEYHYVGYVMYATLLFGTVAGVGAGVTGIWRDLPGLKVEGLRMRRRLLFLSLALFVLFVLVVLYEMFSTQFVLMS